MYAKKEFSLMHENLGIFELIVFSISSIVYSVTLVMITPFALVYTHGVNDVSYDRPVFGIVITIAGVFTCFRIPYYSITTAVGHYKQTRNGAFLEAAINIVVSVVCVFKFGLVGVAIGTLLAAIFRSTQYAIYLSRNILKRSLWKFITHVIVTLSIMAVVYLIGLIIPIEASTIFTWVIKSVIIAAIAIMLVFVTDFIFWNKECKNFIKKLVKN